MGGAVSGDGYVRSVPGLRPGLRLSLACAKRLSRIRPTTTKREVPGTGVAGGSACGLRRTIWGPA